MVIVSGALPEGAGADLPGLADWDEAVAAAAPPPERRCIDVDLASIIYTSGSTGQPKGVMLTHRNMLAAAPRPAAGLG